MSNNTFYVLFEIWPTGKTPRAFPLERIFSDIGDMFAEKEKLEEIAKRRKASYYYIYKTITVEV